MSINAFIHLLALVAFFVIIYALLLQKKQLEFLRELFLPSRPHKKIAWSLEFLRMYARSMRIPWEFDGDLHGLAPVKFDPHLVAALLCRLMPKKIIVNSTLGSLGVTLQVSSIQEDSAQIASELSKNLALPISIH